MLDLTCQPNFRKQIRERLITFDQQSHPTDGLRRAAVALVIVNVRERPNMYNLAYDQNMFNECALILTVRAPKINRHSGQWALPGGRIDPGETAEQTALRELQEEVGLALPANNILGRLDDFTTRSGFVMTPIVIWGGTNCELKPDPAEVESAHRLPVRELLRKDSPQLRTIPESPKQVLLMPIGNSWIAAPTGAILYQFREVVIMGKNTRVAHYEQPTFAWK